MANNIKISRGLINPVNPIDHQAKSVRLTLTPQAIRNDKFDFITGQFDQGYPFNDVYYFCNQNLTSIYKYGSAQYSKNPLTNSIYKISGQNNYSLCSTNPQLCTIVCTPPLTLDPVSCACVPPTECIPQPECTPLPIPLELKNIIHGYAYYVVSPRSVPVPGFGDLPVTCWGGHGCCRTKFKPKIITDNTTIVANRNISMDNIIGYPNCSNNSQIPTVGWTPNGAYERSDTFSFIVPDPSILSTAEFYLECLESNCHNGVTMVFLVGETLGGDPVLLFASCVVPSIEGAKPIGSVDCETASEPVLCNPPPPPPPPPTPTTPTDPPCTPISEASSINIAVPEFDIAPNYTPEVPGYQPIQALYNSFVNDWIRSSHNILLTSTVTGSIAEHIETLIFNPGISDTQLVFIINFQYFSANNGYIISYSVVQPSCISCPGNVITSFTTGYLYNNNINNCSLTTAGNFSNGIFYDINVGPINVSS